MSDVLSLCNSWASVQSPTQALDTPGMPSNTWRTVAYRVPCMVDYGDGSEGQTYNRELGRSPVKVTIPNHIPTTGTIYSQLLPKSRLVLTNDGGFLNSQSETVLEIESVTRVYGGGGIVDHYVCTCEDLSK